jgi:hypothetical protein
MRQKLFVEDVILLLFRIMLFGSFFHIAKVKNSKRNLIK